MSHRQGNVTPLVGLHKWNLRRVKCTQTLIGLKIKMSKAMKDNLGDGDGDGGGCVFKTSYSMNPWHTLCITQPKKWF